MNKKILAAAIASLVVLTTCVGIIQIRQVTASPTVLYRVEVKVTKMNLYNDGDTVGKGEIYMNDPGADWPSKDSTKYKGGFEAVYMGSILLDYYVLSYDITSEGVSHSITSTTSRQTLSYSLMDKDWPSKDDQLWNGYIQTSGTTNGWVSGWSGAKGSTKSLAGGNVKICTSNTISDTYKFTESTNFGTVYTWYRTFTNALCFEIRVTLISNI